MDFFDNVVNKSNALIKEKLNNPFGNNNSERQSQAAAGPQAGASAATNDEETQQNNTLNDPEETNKANDPNSQLAAIAADAEAVAQKAAKGAKNLGSFIFSMANKAGQQVTQTAKQVKQAVENTSILSDLTREQQEFVREHGGSIQAGPLPWQASGQEPNDDMRTQILSLSQDKRNFVRSPPEEANFKYDPQSCYPVALSLLKEDPNLGKMRYELVPKLVNEDTFWCNYFYRVSMLKEMSDKGQDFRKGWTSSRSSSGEGPDEPSSPAYANQDSQASFDKSTTATIAQNPESKFDLPATSQSEDQPNPFVDDDLKNRLRELNIGSLDDDQWDEELQKDLQEFELISGGDVSALDEEALQNEIKEMQKSEW